MKSFTLVFLIFFVGSIFCQINERNKLYQAINTVRATYCLSPVTIDNDLQAATDSIVQARCNNQGYTNPANTLNLNYNWFASWTYDDFYNNVKTVYDNSRNSWTCQGDLSAGDTNFVRLSLVPSQQMACSFSACSGRYFFHCLFRVAPAFPVISQCTCATGVTTTTNTGSTTGTTTTNTGTTTTNNGVTTTVTIDANGNTVTTTVDANGNRFVTITAGTTAPATPAPVVVVTPAPATPAPVVVVTPAPATPAPVVVTPSTPAPTPAPSTSTISPDSIKNGHMTPINNARSCLGVPALGWDDSLASNAQAWANKLAPYCGTEHAFSTSTPPRNEQEEGENIWQYWADDVNQAITFGTNFWNGEVANYDCNTNTCSGGFCGHYTQDISSHSSRIGCGVVRCPSSYDSFGKGKYTGVCRFGKPGNNGQPPLALAGSCSNFPTCKANFSPSARALLTSSSSSSSNTNNTNKSFFSSDSQVVIFALAIIIVVVVIAILIVLLVSSKKNTTNNKDLQFKLLESK